MPTHPWLTSRWYLLCPSVASVKAAKQVFQDCSEIFHSRTNVSSIYTSVWLIWQSPRRLAAPRTEAVSGTHPRAFQTEPCQCQAVSVKGGAPPPRPQARQGSSQRWRCIHSLLIGIAWNSSVLVRAMLVSQISPDSKGYLCTKQFISRLHTIQLRAEVGPLLHVGITNWGWWSWHYSHSVAVVDSQVGGRREVWGWPWGNDVGTFCRGSHFRFTL
jgi:hypothetical protein